MGAAPTGNEPQSRGARMLRTALGGAIAEWLADPSVIEIMLNPDGRLWVDRLGIGIADSGILLAAADGERIIRLVAHHVGAAVHAGSPRVSAELPETGERFEGLLPPVVAAPTFAIRKPAVAVFSLHDYAVAGIMSDLSAEISAVQCPSVKIFWWRAVPAPEKLRSPTRCSPKSRRPRIVSC